MCVCVCVCVDWGRNVAFARLGEFARHNGLGEGVLVWGGLGGLRRVRRHGWDQLENEEVWWLCQHLDVCV